METPIEALRRRLAARAPRGHRRGLPPAELRFTLEGNRLSRPQLEALLGTEDFELSPVFAGADEPNLRGFHLLAFPNLDRRVMSRAALFETGHALADALSLTSAEPDLGEAHFSEPEPPVGALVEGASDLAFWCWVDHPAPPDRQWALKAMRIPEAWAVSPGRGAGILVAQPDTGVAAHAELDAAPIRFDLGIDLVDGDPDPTDPLHASAGNPGHGTGTASVLISGPGGEVLGSAPGAELAPIRCIETVAVFDQSRVAMALHHARRIGADVVTMSLGGVPSRALSAGLTQLVEDGAVVLAAVGNCVEMVVWPARYAQCIAVAGTDVNDRPWRGTSEGAAVDIAAPGELVWRARRRTPSDPFTNEVEAGQGTSFATALAAGAVALWLSHHGRDAVRAEAGRRGVTVQALCRAALAATARVPDGWDSSRHGAGILDAGALLGLDLAAIPAVTEAVDTEEDVEALVPLALEGATPRRLDAGRFRLEVAALALDAARAAAAPMAEAAPRAPSPSLAAALGKPMDTAAPATPALTRPAPEERGRAAGAYLRILGRAQGGPALESPGEAAAALRPEIASLVATLERRFAHGDLGRDAADAGTQQLRSIVLADAERALVRATRDPSAALDRRDTVALEALVRVKGRPSLLVRGGTFDPSDPEIDEEWADALALAGARIPALIRSVGRVELDGQHTGTGFVVAPGVLMTNRHVLEALSIDPSGRDGWAFAGLPEVDFVAEWGGPARRPFRITGVLFAGPTLIGGAVDLRKLDLALLQVEERNALGDNLPPPLALVDNAAAGQGRRALAIVGYPARPGRLPRTADGRIEPEVQAALERIFRFRYDVKRLALGYVDRKLGKLPNDAAPPWAIGHDATTLGGNSGSSVALMEGEDGLPVLGLHMGGQWLEQNYAHVLAAVPALRSLTSLRWIAV